MSEEEVITKEVTHKFRLLSKLRLWDQNPKDIKEDDLADLKEQLELKGQFEPLLVTPNGTIVGGNQRYKAMKELAWNLVWIVELDFKQDDQGLYRPLLDGEMQEARYETIEEGMMDYAIAHNSQYGFYVKTKFADAVAPLNINLKSLRIDVKNVDADEYLKTRESKPKFNLIVPCDNEEEQKLLKEKLLSMGIQVK